MKNYFEILKAKLNSILPGAEFTEETTESEVVDHLETVEASAIAQAEEAATVAAAAVVTADATIEAASDNTTAISSLADAVTLLIEEQKKTNQAIQKTNMKLAKVIVGTNNLPQAAQGDDAIVEAGKNKEGETQFTIGKRTDQVLTQVETMVGK